MTYLQTRSAASFSACSQHRHYYKHGSVNRRCLTIQASGLFGGLQSFLQGSKDSDAKRRDETPSASTSASAAPQFPPYTVISKGLVYDLRLYNVYPVVEMPYERREEGYAALGGYFDGDNADKARFIYTQPVFMVYQPSGRKTMQMFVGGRRGEASSTGATDASQALQQLPEPSSSPVQLAVAGGELVAAMRFDGFITPETAAAARKRLMAALEKDNIQLADEAVAGEFRVGQYGAVHQLGGRLNELYLRVKV